MSAFSTQDFDAERYSSVRPAYPDSFYKILSDYHQGPRELVVDVGCGPGVATFQLSEQLSSFHRVIGTDLSLVMIKSARSIQQKHPQKESNIRFVQSPAESFDFLHTSEGFEKCDMITAVECAHWFDFPKFQEAAAKALRPGGTLAIWGYGDFFFPDYPLLTKLFDDFSGGDKLGPYTQEPGRTIAREMLKDLHYDPRFFQDIEEVYFYEKDLEGKKPDDVPLFMDKRWTLRGLQEYLKSFSAYHEWSRQNPHAQQDITDEIIERTIELYPQLNEKSELHIVWRTFWMFGRRKEEQNA